MVGAAGCQRAQGTTERSLRDPARAEFEAAVDSTRKAYRIARRHCEAQVLPGDRESCLTRVRIQREAQLALATAKLDATRRQSQAALSIPES